MSTSLVGSTNFHELASTTSITSNAPAGLDGGDILIAAVFARSTISGPAGWTKLLETTPGSVFGQRIAIFTKNSVASGDSGAAFTFTQLADARIGITYLAVRGAASILQSASTAISTYDYVTWSITPPSLTATSNGQMLAVFVSNFAGDDDQTPAPPASFTMLTQATLTDYRLAGAYRIVNTGQSNSGAFNLNPAPTWTPALTEICAVTLRIGSENPSIDGYIAASGPLGASGLLGQIPFSGSILASGPLQQPSAAGWHDFTDHLDRAEPARYVMDLLTPGGLVRVPISSWQATLQTETANYVQCVIPACDPWLLDISAASEFTILRKGRLLDGRIIEYPMASAPVQTPTIARGRANSTATISGYAPALTVQDDPPATQDRALQNVRQISTSGASTRIQADVDWLLRPGQRAIYGSTIFQVRFINFQVGGRDASMYVGSDSQGD